ncbi:phosphoketolase [Salix suchowensis]|nr:phosphoketolase [Salix suchowensis]
MIVAMIFLNDNVLLKDKLTHDQIKPRLLGHWGTCPGLTTVYAHINRLIRNNGIEHCMSSAQDSMSPFMPEITQDSAGLKKLISDSVPPEASQGAIHEGGELGYASAFPSVPSWTSPISLSLALSVTVRPRRSHCYCLARIQVHRPRRVRCRHPYRPRQRLQDFRAYYLRHDGQQGNDRPLHVSLPDIRSGPHTYIAYIAVMAIKSESLKISKTSIKISLPLWIGLLAKSAQSRRLHAQEIPSSNPDGQYSSYVPPRVGSVPRPSTESSLRAPSTLTKSPYLTQRPLTKNFLHFTIGSVPTSPRNSSPIGAPSQRNPTTFRVFSPDELVSNKLDAVLDDSGRNFQWDIASRGKGSCNRNPFRAHLPRYAPRLHPHWPYRSLSILRSLPRHVHTMMVHTPSSPKWPSKLHGARTSAR